jgi:hypothetical protein
MHSPSRDTPRPIRTAVAPRGLANRWMRALIASPDGERLAAIVNSCTRATPADDIASEVLIYASHVRSEAR